MNEQDIEEGIDFTKSAIIMYSCLFTLLVLIIGLIYVIYV